MKEKWVRNETPSDIDSNIGLLFYLGKCNCVMPLNMSITKNIFHTRYRMEVDVVPEPGKRDRFGRAVLSYAIKLT